MLNKHLEFLKQDLNIAITAFKKELQKYSLNKINISVIEDITISYYNSYHKLDQISNIIIDNNTVNIKPFDKNILQTIYNEIIKLNMELTPSIYTDTIKIIYPKNTLERRQVFIKKIKDLAEHHKITIRNIRRNTNTNIKNLTKNKSISQDEEKIFLTSIQKNIDNAINEIEKIMLKKIDELNKI
ncbi:MAG TPA: ribosome-recycling factor [Candidatus Azoamicus sp. OHIO2]